MIEKIEKIEKVFKILFLFGIGLVITSFFFEWYYYAYNINGISTIWSFNIIAGWTCLTNNSENYPGIVEIDFMFLLLYIFIIFLIVSIFVYILFEHQLFNKSDFYRKLKNLNYIFPIYLVLNFGLLMYFLYSLFQANLYFPFLKLYIIPENSETLYSLGPGYVLHTISFIFMFPFSIKLIQIPRKFKLKDSKIENDGLVEKHSKRIDFEKIIAKEKLKTDTKFMQFYNDRHQPGRVNLDEIQLEGDP